LHQIAFICSIPAGLLLVAVAPTGVARGAALVFALSLTALYGTSAAYHRLPWSAKALAWMKRLDHAMIFVLIAGTYTPFSLLALHGTWSIAILSVVWAGAIVGIVFKFAAIDKVKAAARRLNATAAAMYVILGWVAVITLPQIVHRLPWPAVFLMVLGGLLYTVGAAMFNRGRPNPVPAVFGYHEVWHSMVIGGSMCHYGMILVTILAIH
jgi:hemolysin III